MPKTTKEWEITCDPRTFGKVRKDKKFPYIVALARAVNALNFIHTSMLSKHKTESPANVRNLINSYLFAAAILYEGIGLIRMMNRTFTDDGIFRNGLHALLRDPVAQALEQDHLNAARNHAVFHFLPERFSEAIAKAGLDRNVFVVALGKKNKSLHYSYADVIAAEMLVGIPSDSLSFWPKFENATQETSRLLIKFKDDAENLIGDYLKSAGFKRE